MTKKLTYEQKLARAAERLKKKIPSYAHKFALEYARKNLEDPILDHFEPGDEEFMGLFFGYEVKMGPHGKGVLHHTATYDTYGVDCGWVVYTEKGEFRYGCFDDLFCGWRGNGFYDKLSGHIVKPDYRESEAEDQPEAWGRGIVSNNHV